jgi:heat shock protein HtpX
MNAFATGMSKNHALVAVSTGLLNSMDRPQVDAVLGHEITHVANGDMVTMALIQGVLNTFVIFLARVLGTLIDRAISGNREGGGGFAYFGIVIVLQIGSAFLASLIVMWFSRWREFRADAGGARLAGRDSMISALQRLGPTMASRRCPRRSRRSESRRGWICAVVAEPSADRGAIAALRRGFRLSRNKLSVIPAKAGIHFFAFKQVLDPGLRRNDGNRVRRINPRRAP